MKTPEIRKGKSLFTDHVTNTGTFAVAYFYFDDYPYLHNHDYWEFSLVTKVCIFFENIGICKKKSTFVGKTNN